MTKYLLGVHEYVGKNNARLLQKIEEKEILPRKRPSEINQNLSLCLKLFCSVFPAGLYFYTHRLKVKIRII